MNALLTKMRQRIIEGLAILSAIISTTWITTLERIEDPITFLFSDGTTETVITSTFADPTMALTLIAIIVLSIVVMLYKQSKR